MRLKLKKNLRKRVLIALGMLAAAFLFDVVIYEPLFPQLTTYDVAIPNLPASLDGFRIVQLSDIHRHVLTPDWVIRRAVNMANSTQPDMVVLTGDYVNRSRRDIDPCFNMLSKLKPRLGTYAILGNHDHWTDAEAVSKSITSHGITLLNNTSAKVENGLYLAGIDDQWAGSPDVDAAFHGVPKDAACVMLSHTPVSLPLFVGHKGLLLTGHTHGGQINIPIAGRDHIPGFNGCPCFRGWYARDDILMYVNRGIGTAGPPARFLSRSEVTLYVLHPAIDGRARVLNK